MSALGPRASDGRVRPFADFGILVPVLVARAVSGPHLRAIRLAQYPAIMWSPGTWTPGSTSKRAIAMGEANRRTLELVQNWCAHLTIEKQGGGGMVEQFTTLPIGPRSLSCPHAAAPGLSGSDLRFLAVDFYDRNCVGCAHRKPVGFPNLSGLIHERDTARAATAAEAACRDAATATERRERDAKRQVIRAALDPARRERDRSDRRARR